MPYGGMWDMSHDMAKYSRIKWKGYTDWVATLPCVICKEYNETVVGHHLKHRWAPHCGGGGQKANDYLTMPLCYEHHRMLHAFEEDLVNLQPGFIFDTWEKATHHDILVFNPQAIKRSRRLFGEDLDD